MNSPDSNLNFDGPETSGGGCITWRIIELRILNKNYDEKIEQFIQQMKFFSDEAFKSVSASYKNKKSAIDRLRNQLKKSDEDMASNRKTIENESVKLNVRV